MDKQLEQKLTRGLAARQAQVSRANKQIWKTGKVKLVLKKIQSDCDEIVLITYRQSPKQIPNTMDYHIKLKMVNRIPVLTTGLANGKIARTVIWQEIPFRPEFSVSRPFASPPAAPSLVASSKFLWVN